MPLPPSSLSRICENIRETIKTGINATAHGITVTIGAPAIVGALENTDEHHLNLFFYRFEPSGFEPGAQPDLPWRLRMFCLITPFANAETDAGGTVSAGENDMRILGEVLRVLHETPILAPVHAGGIEVRSNLVFMSITDEQINQIWSTQGDTHYRPSAVFEVSLTPIVPLELMPEPALVGAVGAELRVNGDRLSPAGIVASGPPVPPQIIDIRQPAWVPAIALVLEDTLYQSLSFDVDSAEFVGFTPKIWVAGDTGSNVDLVWQAWRSSGWESVGAPQSVTPVTQAIDPVNIPLGLPGFPLGIALPETLAPDAPRLQLMLFAERRLIRLAGGPIEILRSAPLLITLWRALP